MRRATRALGAGLLLLGVACRGDVRLGEPTPAAPPGTAVATGSVASPAGAPLPRSVRAVGTPPTRAETPMAGGLTSPRGIAVGPGGEIYVADSGSASEPDSGRVVRIAPDGTTTSVLARAANLTASPHGETYIYGLSDVAVRGDGLLVTVGFGAGATDPLVAPNGLLELGLAGGLARVFDFDRFEQERDPDGRGAGSNATGIAVAPDGTAWVSDAGGNWVAHLGPDGSVNRLVVFPAVDGEEAVPTGLAIGPDGLAYVALFRCITPTTGKGGVARVKADGTYDIVASGLTAPVDVAFSLEGELHVLEFAQDYAPNTGRLLRVAEGGAIEVLVDGLSYPTSLAFDGSGRGYITEMAAVAGGVAGSGRLIRLEPSVLPR